ncbi:AfsA-related hotdog domain-containing protein [Actinokineospora sp.]|uniref:AfsA-related hotdog domain-containing protein n=1 Tax=Actinokineospora sp. TaxID=1872133 RepID=UPI0040380F8E
MDAQQHFPTIHLVGDRFETFAAQDRVETVNRFVGNVRLGVYDELTGRVRLLAGQGVDASDWDTIRTELGRTGLLDRFVLPTRLPEVVPAADVHKRREENVLLADVECRGPSSLAALLRLSDLNEMVVDHVTGQHLSGMILIEAGRQTVLVAVKELVLAEGTGTDHSLVLGSLTAAFDHYVFPIGAELRVELTELATSRPVRREFSAEVTISQAGRVAVRLDFDFQVVRTRVVTRIEATHAASALDAQHTAALARLGAEPRSAAAQRVCTAPTQVRGGSRVQVSSS